MERYGTNSVLLCFLNDKQLSAIYEDVSAAKSTINKVVNIFCVIGVVGITLAILAGILWG